MNRLKQLACGGGVWRAVCVVVIGAASTLSAQYTQAVEVRVKSDMIREFEELQKQFNAAVEKKGELTRRSIWQEVFGNTSTHHILTRFSKYADLDDRAIGVNAMGEAEFARWVARITKCVQNRRIQTRRRHPDLSIAAPEGWKPNLAQVRIVEVVPGKVAAYGDLIKNEILPAYKNAGVAPFFVSRGHLGGSPRTWITVTFPDKFADLDAPSKLRSSMSEEKWSEFVGKLGPLTARVKYRVSRYRDDLSFGGF